MKRLAAVTTIALMLASIALAGEQNSGKDGHYATIKVTVLKDEDGKPVRNASVVLHPVGRDGRQSRGGVQLKTDSEGTASLDGVPYGKLRVQVIAHGLQTFGEDYDIGQPTCEITVKLKLPQAQYSIYK